MRRHRYSRWWRDAKRKSLFSSDSKLLLIQTGMTLNFSVTLHRKDQLQLVFTDTKVVTRLLHRRRRLLLRHHCHLPRYRLRRNREDCSNDRTRNGHRRTRWRGSSRLRRRRCRRIQCCLTKTGEYRAGSATASSAHSKPERRRRPRLRTPTLGSSWSPAEPPHGAKVCTARSARTQPYFVARCGICVH